MAWERPTWKVNHLFFWPVEATKNGCKQTKNVSLEVVEVPVFSHQWSLSLTLSLMKIWVCNLLLPATGSSRTTFSSAECPLCQSRLELGVQRQSWSLHSGVLLVLHNFSWGASTYSPNERIMLVGIGLESSYFSPRFLKEIFFPQRLCIEIKTSHLRGNEVSRRTP